MNELRLIKRNYFSDVRGSKFYKRKARNVWENCGLNSHEKLNEIRRQRFRSMLVKYKDRIFYSENYSFPVTQFEIFEKCIINSHVVNKSNVNNLKN